MIEDELERLIKETQSPMDRILMILLMEVWAQRKSLDEYRYRDIVQKVCSERGLHDEKFQAIRKHFMSVGGIPQIDGLPL